MKYTFDAKALFLVACLLWLPVAALGQSVVSPEEEASAQALSALREAVAAGEEEVALAADIVLQLTDEPVRIPRGAEICLHGHSLSAVPGYPEACLQADGATVRLEELSLGGGVSGRGRLTLMQANVEGDVRWVGDVTLRDATVQGDVRALGDVRAETSAVKGDISLAATLTLSQTTVGGGVFASETLALSGATVAGAAYGKDYALLTDSAVGGAVRTPGGASLRNATVHDLVETGDDCELDGARVGDVAAAGDLTVGASTLLGETAAAGDVVVFADSVNEGTLTLAGELVLNAGLNNKGEIVLKENALVTGGGLSGLITIAEKLAAERVAEFSVAAYEPGATLLRAEEKKLIDLKKFSLSEPAGYQIVVQDGQARLAAETTLLLTWNDGAREQYILQSDEPVDVTALATATLLTARGPLAAAAELTLTCYSNKSCSKKVNQPRKKGTYYLKAAYAGREGTYLASESEPLVFHIVAEAHIATEDQEYLYDGEPHALDFTTVGAPDAAVKVAYYADSARQWPIQGVPRIVGTFYAVASLEATESYAAAEAEAVLTIVRPQPVITMADAAFPYDKVRHGLSYTVTGAPHEAVEVAYYGGTSLDTPLDKKPKEMGVYYVVATLNETPYYEGAQAMAVLTIFQNEDALTLLLQKPLLAVGQKLKLDNLLPYRYIGTVSWRLKDSPIAKLQDGGKLKALSVGEVKVTATTTGGQKKIFKVRIVGEGQGVERVALDTESLTLAPGQTARVRARVTPQTAVAKGLRWVSFSPEVATVESGAVTALAPGKAVIFAVASSGERARLDVLVAEQ